MRSERAWIGAVLLSNSKDPIEYFFCSEPIDCFHRENYLSETLEHDHHHERSLGTKTCIFQRLMNNIQQFE